VVSRWDELRALSHTGAKLSESVGDEETGEIAARVERAVKRLRALLAQRDKTRDEKTRQRLSARVAREMNNAQLSLVVLAEMRQKVLALTSELAGRSATAISRPRRRCRRPRCSSWSRRWRTRTSG
jgi:hypothetical protein